MLPDTLTERFDDALVYASQLHRDQLRKGTRIPYISHLLAVCSLVLEHGGEEDEAIAALLHDAAEDQGGRVTLAAIKDRFGPRVAQIVNECTGSYDEPKPDWRPRKEAYIAAVATRSPSARLVSAADKLHNARCILADHERIGDALWERFSAGAPDQLWYYHAMVAAFLAAGDQPGLAEELRRAVSSLQARCEAA